MVVLISAVAILRRVALARAALILLVIGAMLLATAAGRPAWNRPTAGTIAVMVDLSPSTRGATFRDWSALDRRIHQLLADRPYRLFGFSDHIQRLEPRPQLQDLPCDRTIYDPPPTDAVLLFSDGQFELPPYAPPTYPVIDPAMDDPPDAAVKSLSVVGNRVLATVTNSSTTRRVHWTGAAPDAMPPSSRDFTQFATPADGGEITAALSPGDRWPENDSLSLMMPPPVKAQRWWVGGGCPAGWQSKTELPPNAADYLLPGVIVLNNIPADSLSSNQQRHLQQYVRDLGGVLVIVGGDHAFAAGGYDGSLLEVLSPLASSPPQPAMHWMLLADGSGSMDGEHLENRGGGDHRAAPATAAQRSAQRGQFCPVVGLVGAEPIRVGSGQCALATSAGGAERPDKSGRGVGPDCAAERRRRRRRSCC